MFHQTGGVDGSLDNPSCKPWHCLQAVQHDTAGSLKIHCHAPCLTPTPHWVPDTSSMTVAQGVCVKSNEPEQNVFTLHFTHELCKFEIRFQGLVCHSGDLVQIIM